MLQIQWYLNLNVKYSGVQLDTESHSEYICSQFQRKKQF